MEDDIDDLDLLDDTIQCPRPPTTPNVAIQDETICPVCSQKATDGKHHLHYGGICCYSCRAFFRRAHQSTKSPNFKCRKKRSGSNSSGSSSQHETINCVIDGSARRQCQLCRYKRCLEIGMDPQWVLTPCQKKVRFRHLMKRRKSDIANADADENGQNDTQDNLNNEENSNDSAANISQENGSDNYCAEASSSSQSSMSSYGKYFSKSYKDETRAGKIDELIQGSTYGLSPRQLMQKHKFLKQSWLQPDDIDTQVATLVTATTQKMQEITEEEMSGCDTISTNSELNSPQQPKRYKLDVKSMNPFSKFHSSTSTPCILTQNIGTASLNLALLSADQKREPRNRHMSSPNIIVNSKQAGKYCNTSVPNVDVHPSTSGGNKCHRAIISNNTNEIWKNKSGTSDCQETLGSHYEKRTERSIIIEDPNIITGKQTRKKGNSNFDTTMRKGKLPLKNHLFQGNRKLRFNDSAATDMQGESLDLSSQSDNSVRLESSKQNSHKRRHDLFKEHKKSPSPTSTPAAKSSLTTAYPENCFAENNDNHHSITLQSYSKQVETHKNKDCSLETGSNEKIVLSSIGETRLEEAAEIPDLPLTSDLRDPWQTASQLGYTNEEPGYQTSTKIMQSISLTSYETCCPGMSTQSLENDSLDVSSYVKYKEVEYESTSWLQGVTYDRKKKLEKIDRIFEAFVPAMRTADIGNGFVLKLIGLHKRKTEVEKYNGKSTLKNHLLRSTITEEHIDGNGTDLRLSIKELLKHFISLEESFISFARGNEVFKQLCEKDQTELLTRNSILFVQYLFARYFSSDVALEQLSWLLKGCGISLPMGYVDYNDLQYMSSITFDEFSCVCPLIDPADNCGETFRGYSFCIDNIRDNFKYPHYYNALIALLLLFSNDDSYDLIDHSKIEHTFQETKELAITGYEEFVGFGYNSLNLLISTLHEMSGVFRSQYDNYEPAILRQLSKLVGPEECFEKRNGIRTQIRAVDFSKYNVENTNRPYTVVSYPTLSLTSSLDFDQYTKNLFKGFQKAYLSITNGYVLTTIVDYTVGRLELKDFPNDKTNIRFGQTWMGLFLERSRRVLKLHPEFSERLSDFNRSALWRSNYLLAGALCLAKMESSNNGKEQFMYIVGQLSESTNVFWGLEFEGFHGLRSVNDMPKIGLKTLCCKRLASSELKHCQTLLRRISPLVKDAICFQLISMIMLLDTSNVVDSEDDTPADDDGMDDEYNELEMAMDTSNNMDSHLMPSQYDRNEYKKKPVEVNTKQRSIMPDRFKEINALQKHYIKLLKTRCDQLDVDTDIKSLGDPEKGLGRTMLSFRQLAQYIPFLM